MSEIHDLRSFINRLEIAGQLVRIKRPVNLEYELADVAAALERRRRPAPLFEVVRGSDFEAMLDRYYDLRGWSRDGIPTPATLQRLGLAGYLDESESGRFV